jgi:hypothetical protein
MDLEANELGAHIRVVDQTGSSILVPWKIMRNLCNVVRDWDLASREIVTDVDLKTRARKSHVSFE